MNSLPSAQVVPTMVGHSEKVLSSVILYGVLCTTRASVSAPGKRCVDPRLTPSHIGAWNAWETRYSCARSSRLPAAGQPPLRGEVRSHPPQWSSLVEGARGWLRQTL